MTYEPATKKISSMLMAIAESPTHESSPEKSAAGQDSPNLQSPPNEEEEDVRE